MTERLSIFDPDWQPLGQAAPPVDPEFDEEVEQEARRLRIRAAAADIVRQEQAVETTPPAAVTLADLLAEPDEQVRYRVARLLPTGGRAVLAAQAKTGKTTLRDNLVRALADGGSFLGGYEVEPLPSGRTVVLLDTEMGRGMLRRWFSDQGIGNVDQVVVIPLRGLVGSFDLTDPEKLAHWQAELRRLNAGFVILDPAAPALGAAGLDENAPSDVGRFLTAFDALLTGSGADEGLVIHHMGHQSERSRGASRWRDWPDVEWRLVREQPEEFGAEPDPAAPRYFSAYGRDVDEPENKLDYDPHSRRLLAAGGSRAEARRHLPVDDVVVVVSESQGLTGNSLDARLRRRGVPEKKAAAARKEAVALGLVVVESGPNKSQLHYLPAPVVQVVQGGAEVLHHHPVVQVVQGGAEVLHHHPGGGGAASLYAPPPPPPDPQVDGLAPPEVAAPPAAPLAPPEVAAPLAAPLAPPTASGCLHHLEVACLSCWTAERQVVEEDVIASLRHREPPDDIEP